MTAKFNVSEWLVDRHIDDGNGDQVAVRCGGKSTTYAELLDRIEQMATGLRSIGVRPEERIAMVMLDSVEFIVTFLGSMRIGAIPVPINPLLPGRDLGVIVADSRARVLVASAEAAESLADLLAATSELESVFVTGDELVDQTRPFSGLMTSAADGKPFATWADSPGFWLCTSGTTGRPKLAMHRHADIPATCATYADQVLGATADDRFYSVGPMFHAYGLGNSLTFPFSVGATAILEPTRPPTPRLVADIVAAESPTLFFCIPTFYAALTNADLPESAFASVRFGLSAAESLPAETFHRFHERFGVKILDGIGSTEMLHIFLSNRPDQIEPGTSGLPVPGYEARIIDSDGNEVPDRTPGELLVKGESAASGYWCRTATNRATFDGDWVHTGDLYEKSGSGFFAYLGRVDDMLRVGGEWVSPAEVEACLIGHPGVLEAAVVGEVDSGGCLRPIAHVIPTGDGVSADELVPWCKEHLAGYKRPRRYEIVGDLPKTATGKIQRYKLRG